VKDSVEKHVLTIAESEQILKMNEARMSIINVDDFDPNEMIPKT